MSQSDPMGKATARYDQRGRRLCSAKKRNTNELCGGYALKGMSVCRIHGGASPQAKRKASLRLAELIDPAVSTLAKEMLQAKRSGDRQRAANSILDRAGMPRIVREVESQSSREILMARLLEMRQSQIEQGQDPDDAEHRAAFEVLDGELALQGTELEGTETSDSPDAEQITTHRGDAAEELLSRLDESPSSPSSPSLSPHDPESESESPTAPTKEQV